MPSIVVIAHPSTLAASIRQELIIAPSQKHGAGSADADAAALLRSGQAELCAEHVEQEEIGRNPQLVRPPVDLDGDVAVLR